MESQLMAGKRWSEYTAEERASWAIKRQETLARKREAQKTASASSAEPASPPPLPDAAMDSAESAASTVPSMLDYTPTNDEALARRARLLADLPPEIADLVTDEELAKIEAEETQKALAEKKKRALSDIRALARSHAQVEHDLVPADVLRSDDERRRAAELVTFKVNLPDGGGAPGFRVDGFMYEQGRTYTRPRAVFESLQANHYVTHLWETRFSALNQSERGRSAPELMSRNPPPFEVV
jgi:hypothetical protein